MSYQIFMSTSSDDRNHSEKFQNRNGIQQTLIANNSGTHTMHNVKEKHAH